MLVFLLASCVHFLFLASVSHLLSELSDVVGRVTALHLTGEMEGTQIWPLKSNRKLWERRILPAWRSRRTQAGFALSRHRQGLL